MHNQRRWAHRCALILLVIACNIHVSRGRDIDANLTTVTVRFIIEKDANDSKAIPIMDSLDSNLQDEMINSIETEALRYLEGMYTYFKWSRQSDVTQDAQVRGELVISIRSRYLTGWEVYLACLSPAPVNRSRPLKAVVYESHQTLPPGDDPAKAKQEYSKKISETFRTLIPEDCQLIKEIPLTDNVIVGNEALILPIGEDRLHADIQSELFVRFRSRAPNENTLEGTMTLKPNGNVDELAGGELQAGMQICSVTHFFHKVQSQGWHPRIPILLDKDNPARTAIKVCMSLYKPKVSTLDISPD
ncbi:MAG: hypothetical protein GY809_04215 [Planctomycetes bacterium]|nr:hypothetical protein [Planctomycetota bacterium]